MFSCLGLFGADEKRKYILALSLFNVYGVHFKTQYKDTNIYIYIYIKIIYNILYIYIIFFMYYLYFATAHSVLVHVMILYQLKSFFNPASIMCFLCA